MKKLKKGITRGLLSLGFLALLIVILFGHSDIPIEELKSKYTLESSEFLPMDGMNVHYTDEGDQSDSVPMVLIHGTGSSLHTFEGWTKKLKKRRRVIRPDLPGYGLTGPFPDRDYSMESYVNFLKVFLNQLEVDQCVLAGNSLGGGIAWRFAAEHPEKVHKLILIDATGYSDKAQSEPIAFEMAKVPVFKHAFRFITPRFVAKSSVENVYADKSLVTEELVDRYFELTLREGNRQAFVDRLAVEKDTTASKKISSIEIPTLVLWGAEDQLIPVKSALRFHKDLPNDTLVILPNPGHVPMEENPEESIEPVLAFLKN